MVVSFALIRIFTNSRRSSGCEGEEIFRLNPYNPPRICPAAGQPGVAQWHGRLPRCQHTSCASHLRVILRNEGDIPLSVRACIGWQGCARGWTRRLEGGDRPPFWPAAPRALRGLSRLGQECQVTSANRGSRQQDWVAIKNIAACAYQESVRGHFFSNSPSALACDFL